MIFVTSWDDGHPLDVRLADLLDRFGLQATFFVPIHNREGRPVLSANTIRKLDKHFEIGSHTLDHACLTELPGPESVRQIVQGKIELEQQLGHAVTGFCYPRGKWNAQVRSAVIQAGFLYARSIENLRLDYGQDPFTVPTTIQFFPHGKQVIFRNFLRYGHYLNRRQVLTDLLRTRNWLDRLSCFIDKDANEGKVFHVWGHSWEIEEQCLWGELEKFLSLVSARSPVTYTIGELMQQREELA